MNEIQLNNKSFSEDDVIHLLKHYLPSQQALKDFIHHNTLHAMQGMKFYDAIFRAKKIFGFNTHLQLSEYRDLYRTGRISDETLCLIINREKGESLDYWKDQMLNSATDQDIQPRIGSFRKKWRENAGIELDNLLHPKLFRILSSYFDQGISIDAFPNTDYSFIASIQEIEKNSNFSFFESKKIRSRFISGDFSISTLLYELVGDEKYFQFYLFDMLFAHQGWSGFVNAIEDFPGTLMDRRKITLREWISFELLMELDMLQSTGKIWKPLANYGAVEFLDILSVTEKTHFDEVIQLWQNAFEWSYYDEILLYLEHSSHLNTSAPKQKKLQAIFCIDERECSFRRHLESLDDGVETFGAPGFFGVEFFFNQEGSLFYDKLCPAPVTPKYLVKEKAKPFKKHTLLFHEKQTNNLQNGFYYSVLFGAIALIKIFANLWKPKMSLAISNAFAHMSFDAVLTIENKSLTDIENGLQIGYTIDEMYLRAKNFLSGIGLLKEYADIIYIVAHGSSSANNPHHGAHDCGACSGRPGATNARVMAYILNKIEVRRMLASDNIIIPADTIFVGAMHDTAADTIGYYDLNYLNKDNNGLHQANVKIFEAALDLNARERSRRFASIDTKRELKTVRSSIFKRAVSLFEPRPELGHGTNALAIIGRRDFSKHVFLDRRAFLNSYDYRTDPNGEVLLNVMKPIGLVCGGINLEYYFSRVDNIKLGAGTKLPHNVVGLFGVTNGSDGDLRPGLPWQMVEVHDPVRLMVIVEHRPEIVLKAIQSSPDVFEWYKNEWVHIMAFDPYQKKFYRFINDSFQLYQTIKRSPKIVSTLKLNKIISHAQKMETNEIADATKENLPPYILNH